MDRPVSDGGSPVTGYKVYRGTPSGGETLLTTLGNVTSFNDTGLSNGTTYFYKVTRSTPSAKARRQARSRRFLPRPRGLLHSTRR